MGPNLSLPESESSDNQLVGTTGAGSLDRLQVNVLRVAAIAGVIAVTVIVTLWVSRDSERAGVEIHIPPPAPITFQVSGEVVAPGVYSLEGEPRINDAIDRAGGLTDDAAVDLINLALPVRDGSKVVVPSIHSVSDSSGSTSAQTGGLQTDSNGGLDSSDSIKSGGLVDLNTASHEQLVALPGVGDSRAASIIEWRANNLITSVDDLLSISGIGPATVSSIRDHVVQP